MQVLSFSNCLLKKQQETNEIVNIDCFGIIQRTTGIQGDGIFFPLPTDFLNQLLNI